MKRNSMVLGLKVQAPEVNVLLLKFKNVEKYDQIQCIPLENKTTKVLWAISRTDLNNVIISRLTILLFVAVLLYF